MICKTLHHKRRHRETNIKPLLTLLLLLLIFTLTLLNPQNPPETKGTFPDTGTLIFEWGAEENSIKPPWDGMDAYPHKTGYGTAEVRDTLVRTGNKSLYVWQKDPTKTDYERRVHIREYGTSYSAAEIYFSWWVYFPSAAWSQPLQNIPEEHEHWIWTATLGGLQLWFNIPGQAYKFESVRFQVYQVSPHDTRKRIQSNWAYWKYPTTTQLESAVMPGYLDDNLDQWIQFQIRFKLSQTSSGVVQTWVKDMDTLLLDETGITDPRGYSAWNAGGYEFRRDENPDFGIDLYMHPTESFDAWNYIDDCVVATDKVSSTYGVGGQSPEFTAFEDGFESNDFSKWNGTQYSGGGSAPSITSTDPIIGDYSANCSTDGTQSSYSRIMHTVTNVPSTGIYIRSKLKFSELPDTDDTWINVIRIATAAGSYISTCGVRYLSGSYYWFIDVTGGTVIENQTLATISANTEYNVELHMDTVVSGNMSLYIDQSVAPATAMCYYSGDFSSFVFGRVYPYIYVENGNQVDGKSVIHDAVRVDKEYVGGGTKKIFQAIEFQSYEEEEMGGPNPLANVLINGTHVTDAGGYYTWENLDYNETYLFIIDPPTGYYPAWCVNIEGSFSWNGSAFLVYHLFTEVQEGYLEIAFYSSSLPYIQESTAKLTYAAYDSPYMYVSASPSTTKTIKLYTITRPTYFKGQSYSQYDYYDNVWTVSFSSSKSFVWSWQDFDSIKIYGTDGEVTAASYTSNTLSYSISKTGTSQTQVYLGTKGQPLSISPSTATTSYNSQTLIYTVTFVHSSVQNFILSWVAEGAVTTSNWRILLYQNDTLGIGSVGNYYIIITVLDGTINSSSNDYRINLLSGYIKFNSANSGSLKIHSPNPSLYVTILGASTFKDRTTGFVYSDYSASRNVTISWGFRETIPPLFPITFMLGMVGIVGMFAGPLYATHKIKKGEYRAGFVNGLIWTSIGIALFIAWLWG